MLYADKAAKHALSPPGLLGIYTLNKTCLTAQTRYLWVGQSLVSAPLAGLHLPTKCTEASRHYRYVREGIHSTYNICPDI